MFAAPVRPILFIDEIHRFSKSQQDSLLGAVENGTVTLIGATTENPSFEIIRPLLSRAQVYVLKPLDESELQRLLDHTIANDEILKNRKVRVEQTTALFRYAGGDARKLLNILDLLEQSAAHGEEIVINDRVVTDRLQENPQAYDKNGEMHYDIISAFIKSIRGSDPDAAVYWLARMIAGGEDAEFIARRLVIVASEDSECTIYLATCPKSNSAYLAIDAALEEVRRSGNLPVPLHLRNAPTSLMKKLDYGKEYKYAHDYPGHFVRQQFRPDEIKDKRFWEPCPNPAEDTMSARQKARWGE